MKRKRVRWVLTLAASIPALSHVAQPDGQTARITGDRVDGVVLPIEPIDADIRLSALRASVWQVDDTQRLLLEGDVSINLGQFHFQSEEAAVWLNRIPSAEGPINQMAVYFDEVEDPGREAGLGVAGRGLLVTGSARGAVRLKVALLQEESRSGEGIVRRGEHRLAEHLRKIVSGRPALEQFPQISREEKPPEPALVPGGAVPAPPSEPPQPDVEMPPTDVPELPIFIPTGRITLNAGSIEVRSGEEENVIIASGDLIVDYTDDRGPDGISRLTLSAARGVVFTKPGPISEIPSLALEADFVKGVYLEGNVMATDGEYTVRGSRVYYDVETNRAIMLDAVMRTYSRQVNRPVYARAEEVRQISRQQWSAERATVSTSEFFTPHLAIGAGRALVTQQPAPGAPEETETYIRSENNTIRLGGVPVFYWPQLSGTVSDIPLERLEVRQEDNMGTVIESAWDLHALMGLRRPEEIDVSLKLDGRTERGIGAGVEFRYDYPATDGVIDVYVLPDDHGIDKTVTGRQVDPQRDFRGLISWEHQTKLNPNLTFQAQAFHVSDPSLIPTFREDDFEERREYETSAYLRNLNEHTAWTLLAKEQFDDFLNNGWLLASRQYSVDKLPEATYRRYGDKLFVDWLTYSSEYRASRMRLRLDDRTPREHGIRGRAFGIDDDDDINDALEARGLTERWVNRLDTRHELSIPLKWGAVNVNPFLVGRATWYDEEFDAFSSDSDDLRLFGSAGVRISTVLQHVNNGVESRLFDLHRLRHLVEPSILLWYGWSDVDQGDLPTFDEEVESLADGAAVRLGLKNTWQTQRGGPGHWQSVDFFTLDTALIFTSGETDLEHPVPRFYEYRPEYSNLRDHFDGSFSWLVSDTLAILGETIVELDQGRVALGSIGTLLQHSPMFSTYIEYRFVDASENELLEVGWEYQITPKYRIRLRPQWDFREDNFRSVRMDVTRAFPDFEIAVSVRHDEIKNDTALSASMRLASF